jgi:glycosyltransferase involved in cell wall biosynthesis
MKGCRLPCIGGSAGTGRIWRSYAHALVTQVGTMKMRVGIVTHEFPPHVFGGIGIFSQNLAKALVRRGVEVLVIAGSTERNPNRTEMDGLSLVQLPRGPFPPRHLWFQLRNINTIMRELDGCDVVHGQDCASYPLLAHCKRIGLKIPWVITFHTNPHAELRLAATVRRGSSMTDIGTYVLGFPLWDAAFRSHMKLADRLVAVSASLREELCDAYKVKKSAVNVIHTCVDFDGFQSLVSQPSKDGVVRLFYAGRLYYRKGVAHLLEIVQRLFRDTGISNFHLDVFGSGPLKGSLSRYVARNGLEAIVSLNGFVSREKLLTSLGESDIVCIPSLYEACPVLMIEAMCLGKPVVAFDLPFARELLGTSAHHLLGHGSDGFASVLRHLIESDEDRVHLGRLLKENAKRFDSRRIASEYSSIYNELL